MKIRISLLVTVAAISILPSAALAQSGETGIQEADNANPSRTIVVTGEKIDRNLQDTVSSVAIITGDQLELDGIDSLADSFNYVANVNLGDSEGGFSIRGVPFDNLLGAGSSPLAQIYVDDVTIGDQATRFGVDNIWDVSQIEILRGAQSTVQGRNALAGAIIIRTTDPTYQWEGKARAVYINADTGGDEYSIAGAVGGPIIDDILAFRVAAERRESDGFISNPVIGRSGADFNNQWQVRAKLLLEAAPGISTLFTFNYNETTVADAVSDRRSRDANGFVNFTDVVPGNEFNRESFRDAEDFNKNTNTNLSAKTTWEVSDDLTFTSITALSDSRNEERLDTDGTNLDPAFFPPGPLVINNPFNIPTVPASLPRFAPEGTQLEDQSIFTQELTAYYDNGGRFRGLIGAYYAKSKEDEFNFTPGIQPGLLAIVDGATRPGVNAALIGSLGPLRGIAVPGNPVAAIPAGPAGDAAFDAFIAGTTDFTVGAIASNYGDIGSFIAATSEPLDIENYAFYFSGEYDLTDRLTVGFGLRFDNENQVEGLTISGDSLGQPDPANPVLPAGFPAALVPIVQGSIAGLNGFFDATLAEASTVGEQSFNAWLPSGFLRYEIDDDRSVSFSVRRGYRSGGSDLNIVRQFVSQFDPEFTTNFEFGLRSFWFDRKLRVNLNAFYTDWTDQQLVVSLSALQQDEIGFNVGSSTLKGFEIDTLLQATDNLSLQVVVGYSDTSFEDFDTALAETAIAAQSQTAPIELDQLLQAFSGREFSFAPNWSGAARLAYQDDSGLFGVLGVTFEGSSFVNNAASNSPTFLDNDSRVLVNLTAGYEFDGYSLAFIGRNLLNKDYVSSGGDALVRLGAPRELGIRLQKKF